MSSDFQTFKIHRKNYTTPWWGDLYHHFLHLSWRGTLLLFFLFFIFSNLCFGFCYWFTGSEAFFQMESGFWNAFFFSVQTMATIGYGTMSPKSPLAHIVVTFEAAYGVLSFALISGLFFAKFSLPKSKLRFSRSILYAPFEGEAALHIRVVNERQNQLIDAKIKLTFLHPHVTQEGVAMRRFESLALERSEVPFFALSLNVIHRISSGMLKSMTCEEMQNSQAELILSLTGTDSTTGQLIHKIKTYSLKQIVRAQRWADMITVHTDGSRELDFAEFDRYLLDSVDPVR